jgi:hypothetical protein
VLKYGMDDSAEARTGGAGPFSRCCDERLLPLLAILFSAEGMMLD